MRRAGALCPRAIRRQTFDWTYDSLVLYNKLR